MNITQTVSHTQNIYCKNTNNMYNSGVERGTKSQHDSKHPYFFPFQLVIRSGSPFDTQCNCSKAKKKMKKKRKLLACILY